MTTGPLPRWLDAWGYHDTSGALHVAGSTEPADHPYRAELHDLLRPDGEIRARAVFDVEGVPTVCFIEDDGRLMNDPAALDAVRKNIWNQNLISIVLTVDDARAMAASVGLRDIKPEIIELSQAKPFGPYSREDVQSGSVFSRHPDWFLPETRVDRVLLRNLAIVVGDLEKSGLEKGDAQLLMAQVMFVAYLEHRGIVGDSYRKRRNVGGLHDLVRARDRAGITRLLAQLKNDFNGDLLEPTDGNASWRALSDWALQKLEDFLGQADLDSNQLAFWSYDFRYIPVELISGIYESFLSEEKRDVGAYYTPRHLATLVVDQALSRSNDILRERVYDGACGSGILLTTAYRRMLAHAEVRVGRQLSFPERVKLLQGHIFGSDISKSACKVTAFSLYLSVLEHLEPADITDLATKGGALLPKLLGGNIRAGRGEGDFFSPKNPYASSKQCTVFISNPPWVEPPKTATLTADGWAKRNKYKIPRRQVCGAFMLRALDSTMDDGTLCFILPVSILAAQTSRDFVRVLLDRCRVETIINFGDLRKLLFDEAKQPTIVVVARPRSKQNSPSVHAETIEYWVPKTDVSLAFGRLTLHGTDRHVLTSSSLARDNSLLTTLFWGTPHDLATVTRLKLHGTLGDILKSRLGWRSAKGFHLKDASVDRPASSRELRNKPYLNARHFATHGPLLDNHALESFPNDIKTVARLPKALLETFRGPRIVFTDGMTPEREVSAAFSTKPFSFNSSIGALAAPPKDGDLLRFLAAFLRSDLVRYLLLLTAYQVSFERERVAVADLKGLPFVTPEQHSNPVRAEAIVAEVAAFLRDLDHAPHLERSHRYAEWKRHGETLFAEYFGLSVQEKARVHEVTQYVLPSVQPSSYAGLRTLLQHRASKVDTEAYAKTLMHELGAWRDAMSGRGNFQVYLILGSDGVAGGLGIVRLDIGSGDKTGKPRVETQIADNAVVAMLEDIKRYELLPLRIQENLYLAADTVIRHEQSLYLVKPLIRRLWLRGEAYRDAERVVRFIQGKQAL
ncbi:MAG: N-6 DNA methylase [Gammaproteobacteria bacterium]|nr:N-6 DNA methylase [Gammaproteobacteria bacterium]